MTEEEWQQAIDPRNSNLRNAPPGLLGRFSDGFRAADNLTENAGFAVFGDPEMHKGWRESLARRRDQYPPQNGWESAATKIGGYTKDIIDPVGFYLAVRSGSPLAAGAAGGMYEGTKSALGDAANGEAINTGRVLGSAIGGAAGAYAGDKLVGSALEKAASSRFGDWASGVAPEIAGRVAGSSLAEASEDYGNPLGEQGVDLAGRGLAASRAWANQQSARHMQEQARMRENARAAAQPPVQPVAPKKLNVMGSADAYAGSPQQPQRVAYEPNYENPL